MRNRIAPFTMTAVLLAGGAAAVTAGSAGAAEPKTDATAQAVSCLGTAKYYTSAPGHGSSNAHWPGTGIWAYTTSNCQDINVKVKSTRSVRTCFKATGKCNGWKTAKAGKWMLAATNVKDRSGFYIQFKGTARSYGWIAY
ncbi:hypothetical protein AB0436_27905 [Streptomyces sp. NPDC051322]|uniref:hypothetical protein n=1 Tax=Streptomyces sp. NPDC051322 TaxID=3154645 RepID=UPI00344F6ED6